MSGQDNITLPREVVKLALEAFEAVMPFSTTQRELKIRAVEALRTHLAAEQPKPEPVAWMDRFGSVVLGKGPYETFTTPLYTFPPALAAEPTKPTKPTKPKQEPVGWQERHIYPNASGWSVWYPCRWRLAHEPLEQLEQSGITYQWRPVYAAIDAAMEDKT